jgi:tetratricopeptide (TPR) repeat protein/transcriptional regulator with XRE-family HTH domain
MAQAPGGPDQGPPGPERRYAGEPQGDSAGSVRFGELLRQLRTDANLTQEELAAAASLSPRSVSDLERGVNLTARRDTARLLADALGLAGAARTEFEAAARGRAAAGQATAGRPEAGPAPIRSLPRDIASFTGREPQLRELMSWAADAARSGGVVGIHAIGGMAGIGKTTLAVHAAHLLAEHFPAGQIFLPLHGHTRGQRPAEPEDALASLLLTAGVPAQQIPPGLEARMALWRDRLSTRQLLLVLDDAADSAQVRPLLPGAGGSLVLVTSRRHLSALEDSQAISLDTLPPEDAGRLLVRLANRPGLEPADAAVGEIARLCGYLPLAVGMLARQLHHHPAWAPAGLAAELASARDRLELMQAENLSVAAAFNLSYADLSEAQQRMFRRLGLHPGSDIEAYAAAALAGTGLAAARALLDALYDHYLLSEPARGRYRLHDLIREHAHALAARDDPGRDRDLATGRLLGYYQKAADTASRRVARYTRPSPERPEDAVVAVPDLPDGLRALSWARAERANLLACLDQVTRAGQDRWIVTLTAAIASFLRHDGLWTEAIGLHTTAVHAARRLGDRAGEAGALHDLGTAYRLTGDKLRGTEVLEQALAIFRDLGDRQGEVGTLVDLGDMRQHTADHAGAVEALTAALSISRDLGDRLGQARALNNLGAVRYVTGDYPGTVEAQNAALAIYRDLGDQRGQADALRYLGVVQRRTGDYPGAAATLGASLRIYRDLGDRLGQTNVLSNLGVALRLTRDYAGAVEALDEALRISRDIGSKLGQAMALNYLGMALRLAGDYSSAADALEEALELCRDLGDRGAEAEVLNEAGTLQRARGDLGRAEAYHQQALDLAREIDATWDEAHALAGLGRDAQAAGRTADGQARLREAQEIFQRLGDAEADVVAEELRALGAKGADASEVTG